jgi:hypothetical protein
MIALIVKQYHSCIASARILSIEKKKELKDSLKCKKAECIKIIESLEKASLSATEIRNEKHLHYLSVIKIKSKEQADIIRKISLKEIYAKERDVNSAIRCLCKHPVPESTLPPESKTREKWIDLLVKKYKDPLCDYHDKIKDYFSLLEDKDLLTPKEKGKIPSLNEMSAGASHA